MADEPFYTPGRVTPTRQPRQGEPFWTLRREHVTWSCELRFHGESYDWEAQILRDGEIFAGQRFVLRELAQEWAEAERQNPRERRRVMAKRQSVHATTEEIETAKKAAFSAAKKITAFLAKDPTVPDDTKGVAAAVKALNSYVRLVNREVRLKVAMLATNKINTP